MNGKFTPSKAFRPPFLIPGSHARPSRTELGPAWVRTAERSFSKVRPGNILGGPVVEDTELPLSGEEVRFLVMELRCQMLPGAAKKKVSKPQWLAGGRGEAAQTRECWKVTKEKGKTSAFGPGACQSVYLVPAKGWGGFPGGSEVKNPPAKAGV